MVYPIMINWSIVKYGYRKVHRHLSGTECALFGSQLLVWSHSPSWPSYANWWAPRLCIFCVLSFASCLIFIMFLFASSWLKKQNIFITCLRHTHLYRHCSYPVVVRCQNLKAQGKDKERVHASRSFSISCIVGFHLNSKSKSTIHFVSPILV